MDRWADDTQFHEHHEKHHGSTITNGTGLIPTNLLGMDPQSGAADTEWTAPSSGLFTITGSFQGTTLRKAATRWRSSMNGGTVLLGPTTISSYGQVVNFSLTENLNSG